MPLSPNARRRLVGFLKFNEEALANLEKEDYKKGSNGEKLVKGFRRQIKLFRKMLG